jgi:DinB superfamily
VTGADPRAVARLKRLDGVEERLRSHASRPQPAGLTDPDPPTGERWDYGQVWAHLGEFVPYWVEQVRIVADPARDEPVPFGRTKADPVRVAAIERDRRLPPQELMARLSWQLDEVRTLITELPAGAWNRRGLHPTLGVMDLPTIFDEFLVGHLEAHAKQLDGLRDADATTAATTGDAKEQ